MNFKVEAEDLISALKATAELLKDKKANPVLGYYLFKLDADSLTIRTSCDDGTSLAQTVDAEKEMTEEYSFLCPQKIKDIVSLVKGKIDFNYDSNGNTLKVSYQSGNTEIGVMDASTYPEAEFKTDTEEYTAMSLPADMLAKGFAFCIPFLSDSPIRPVLGSVHIDIKDGNITFVGTSGLSLATYKDEAKGCPNLSCNISGKSVSALLKMLITGDTNIQFNGSAISFGNGKSAFSCPVVIGNYPNYERVIPDKASVQAYTELDKEEILHSATMVSICTSKTSKLVKMSVNGESLTLDGEDLDNGSRASGFSFCQSAEFKIGLNIELLSNALKAITAKSIGLSYIDSQKPLIMTAVGDDKYMILLMPCNI